ncbi:hypothetical protein P171DRAFT_428759 [Karstenula rhodostoma CBS 690.94]|uniref:Uncharacterized protein n=1 Tax=Karstenula rhodostoma CBS 690.94 TaxID=1392251 RepID=A0A9P4UG32_9PLEO|nr:hypothetical protein P171DRAFT_428759 [Karstenula rhodostoma CBS 690.94]
MGTNAHECAHLRSSPEKLFVMWYFRSAPRFDRWYPYKSSIPKLVGVKHADGSRMASSEPGIERLFRVLYVHWLPDVT